MGPPHLTKGSRTPIPVRGKLRLYSNRFCPYAQRVHLVLDAKKIPYDVINISLANKPEWFYDKSPLGKVPALEIDRGDVIYESLIISDYLDERFHQRPLHSPDPLQKAKDRLLIEQFNKIVTTMQRMLLGPAKAEDEQCISDGLKLFENELNARSSPFFSGQHPGMLDYMIWPWCERADLLKSFGQTESLLEKEKYSRLMQWKNLMGKDAAVRKSMLDSTTHTKFLHSQRNGIPEYDALLRTNYVCI